MQLVYEEDDLAAGARRLLDDSLETLLELAAVLGASQQAAHVELHYAFVLQPFWYVLVHYAQRQTFGDGGLTDAGLSYQHGVVLGAPQQDLHRAPDFVIAADDGIELAFAGAFGQVYAGIFESFEGASAERLSTLRPPRMSSLRQGGFGGQRA